MPTLPLQKILGKSFLLDNYPTIDNGSATLITRAGISSVGGVCSRDTSPRRSSSMCRGEPYLGLQQFPYPCLPLTGVTEISAGHFFLPVSPPKGAGIVRCLGGGLAVFYDYP